MFDLDDDNVQDLPEVLLYHTESIERATIFVPSAEDERELQAPTTMKQSCGID